MPRFFGSCRFDQPTKFRVAVAQPPFVSCGASCFPASPFLAPTRSITRPATRSTPDPWIISFAIKEYELFKEGWEEMLVVRIILKA